MREFLRLKMDRSRGSMFLFVFICLAQFVNAQNYTTYNWYFGDSQYGILFNKSDGQANQTDLQATPFGTGGSAVATDRVSGDLLLKIDG